MDSAKYLVLWLSIFILPNWGNTSTKHLERNTFFTKKIKIIQKDLYQYLNLRGEALSSYKEFVMPTHTTISDGNWNDPATWQGGNIPSNALSGLEVTIKHAVNLDTDELFIRNGILNIQGILTITDDDLKMDVPEGVLNIDHGLLILTKGKVDLKEGTINLNHGAIQLCDGNYEDDSDGGTNGNGYIFSADGNIKDKKFGNFSTSIAWCNLGSGGGSGSVSLPTPEDCVAANPTNGCGDTTFYLNLCTASNSCEKTIGGRVFYDANEDGIDNDGMNGLRDIIVNIYDDLDQNGQVNTGDTLLNTLSTDSIGAYNYTFTNNLITHLAITTDITSIDTNYYYVTDNIETAIFATAGGVDTLNDFGVGKGVKVENEIWLDLNSNMLQDPLEIGLKNLAICMVNQAPVLLNGVLLPANAYQDTILTDTAGIYVFENLPDCDNWQLTVHNPPTLYTATYDADGGILGTINFKLKDGIISSMDNSWCESSDCLEDLDFGFRLAGEFDLAGIICIDDGSKDGICSTGGEATLEALDVLLFDDKGTFFGGVNNEDNGAYLFPFLPATTYIVSLNINQRDLDTLLLTTTVADTPAEEILITDNAIFQKVPVAANVVGVDYAFISHANNQSTLIVNDDIFSFCSGLSYSNWVGGNDTIFGDAYFYSTVVMPQKGTLELNNDGIFQYQPTIFECGTDEFRYQVCDLASGDCDTAMVTLIFEDTIAPSLTNIPSNITISCDEFLPSPALVSTFDNCPRININIAEQSTKGEDGCSQYDYELKRIWTATDLCGNANSATQSITVEDVVAPNIFRIYQLPNGKKLIAGITELTREHWKTIPFPIDFDNKPLVFSQIMTNNEMASVITQIRAVSKTQFELRLKEEEAADNIHHRESIAWIAIEEGAQLADYQLIAGKVEVGTNAEEVSFINNFANIPVLFTTQQTTDANDPTIIAYQNLNIAKTTLRLVEETSKDEETNHNKEEVAYLGIESIGDLTNENGDIIGEIGTAIATNNWTTIALNHTYYNPVIIANPVNENTTVPIIIRVNNVAANSFSVQASTWNYLNNPPINTTISYLVIEGSIPLYTPTFCETGTDSLTIGKDIIAIDNCDRNVDLAYTETKRFNNGEQVIDRYWTSADECGNEVAYTQQITCEGIAVEIKTYLQGALVGSNQEGLMRDDLRRKRLIPPEEPYSFLAAFEHFGNGGGEQLNPDLLDITGENAIVDWVLIEIRSGVDRTEIVATSAGLVQRDGDIISATGDSLIVFENIPYGDYFVGVRHRNHIGVITQNTYSFALNNIPKIDFRNVFTPTDGNRPGIQIAGKNALWSGDLNGDGKTIYQGPKNDPFEMFLSVILDAENEHFLVNYINRGYTHRDFNLDGQVIFQGPNNDRSNLLFNTILAHPDNDKFLANFIVVVSVTQAAGN